MTFPLINSNFGIKPKKVLHIGGNIGQEVPVYHKLGIPAYHVEASPDYFEELALECEKYSDQEAIQACLTDKVGDSIEFNLANNKQSSSILGIGRHAVSYPTVSYISKVTLPTNTVDNLLATGEVSGDIDFMIIDVQGAEDKVLAGSKKLLESGNVWGLVVETALDPLYEGGGTFRDICIDYLDANGYFLRQAFFNDDGWSDALFLKRWWRHDNSDTPPLMEYSNAISVKTKGRNIAVGGMCRTSSRSIWSRSNLEAGDAVNGYKKSGFSFHTDEEDSPWWMIDFGEVKKFDEILCYNRIDREAERAKDLVIEISDDNVEWNIIHRNDEVFGGFDGSPLRVSCPNTHARFVRLRIPGRTCLHLSTVEIYDWNG